jgi:hypothetical protein
MKKGYYWTVPEIRAVAEHYRKRGVDYCVALTGRSRWAIYKRAQAMGLRLRAGRRQDAI